MPFPERHGQRAQYVLILSVKSLKKVTRTNIDNELDKRYESDQILTKLREKITNLKKIINQEGRGFLNFLKPIMSVRLPLMKNALKLLVKKCLVQLGVTATA